MRFFKGATMLQSDEQRDVARWLWTKSDHRFHGEVDDADAELLLAQYIRDYIWMNRKLKDTKDNTDAIQRLRKIDETASKLSGLLTGIEYKEAFRGPTINYEVISRSIGVDTPLSTDGTRVNLLKAEFSLASLLQEVANVAKLSQEERKKKQGASRPKLQLLVNLCFPLIRIYWCFGLMAGETVQAARPSRKNGGFRWICSVIERLGDDAPKSPWKSEFARQSWSTTSIEQSIRLALKESAAELSIISFLEPETEWPSLGWDSYVGLHMFHCSDVFTLKEDMMLASKHGEDYLEKENQRHDA